MRCTCVVCRRGGRLKSLVTHLGLSTCGEAEWVFFLRVFYSPDSCCPSKLKRTRGSLALARPEQMVLHFELSYASDNKASCSRSTSNGLCEGHHSLRASVGSVEHGLRATPKSKFSVLKMQKYGLEVQ